MCVAEVAMADDASRESKREARAHFRAGTFLWHGGGAMSRALLGLASVIAVASFTGCGTRACKPGTILVDVSLEGGADAADTFVITVLVDAETQTATVPHPSGARHGTLEVDFAAGYPQGKTVTLTVDAFGAGRPLASGSAAPTRLTASCASLSVDLRATSAAPDMAEPQESSGTVPGAPDMTAPVAPRLIAPPSTSTVTSQQPTFKWTVPASATDVAFELCRDRPCTNKLMATVAVDASGTSGTPAVALPSGVLFWRVTATIQGVRQTSATWEVWVGARTATKASTSFGTVLDVNGDGFADVIAGARYAKDVTGNQAGRAYLYFGSPSGLGPELQLLDAGAGPGSIFAGSVASAGDVNGDGYADAIVGAMNAKDAAGNWGEGRAYLYLGSPHGLATTTQILDEHNGATAYFGESVASAGDVNGDGYADVIVGAGGAKGAGDAGTGRVYLYFGSASGLGTTPQLLKARDEGYSNFGYSVASAGDVNGDGYADVIVGAEGAKDAAGNAGAGRAYLYLGGSGGLSATPQLLDGRDGAVAAFGIAVASAGDVNGDGYADVIVGAEGAADAAGNMGAGRAYLYLGGPSGLGATPQLLDGRSGPSARFGVTVASAGDVNGDGYADVVVGASYAKDAAGEMNAGCAYLYLGGQSGLGDTPQLLDGRDGAVARFGTSVAGAGDVNGDGWADVVVGAENAKDAAGNPSAGRAYLYFGGIHGLAITPQLVDGPAGGSGLFGGSVASFDDVTLDRFCPSSCRRTIRGRRRICGPGGGRRVLSLRRQRHPVSAGPY
jgi:hypothetical protein